jgi:hypothetical protein
MLENKISYLAILADRKWFFFFFKKWKKKTPGCISKLNNHLKFQDNPSNHHWEICG